MRSATQDNGTTKQTDNVEKNTERTMNIPQASEAENTRRNTQISKKRKHYATKSAALNVRCQDITAEYVCESAGCGRAFYSERGLCIHKRTCQKRQAPLRKPLGGVRMHIIANTNNTLCRTDSCQYLWRSASK